MTPVESIRFGHSKSMIAANQPKIGPEMVKLAQIGECALLRKFVCNFHLMIARIYLVVWFIASFWVLIVVLNTRWLKHISVDFVIIICLEPVIKSEYLNRS